ncbi:hypothetical protein KLP28_11070 [Nocardioidaceae bacterium]|nr:hypothetical protein KLP28_11070 [Nocardioidaceae bacterium]
MPDRAEPDRDETAEPAGSSPEQRSRRRARLAEVFGDVLPEQTSDDDSTHDGGTSDAWLRRQVPPHHG